MNPFIKESQWVFNWDHIIHHISRSRWILVSTQSFDVPPNGHNEYQTMHEITKGTQSQKVIKPWNWFWTNKTWNCMHKITRIQLFIIDEASSSTLVEGLAYYDNNRQETINWNHWESKLTIKKHLQRPRHDKSRVFDLYGASQPQVTQEKNDINNKKTRVFRSLPNQLECARSHLVGSSTMCSIAHSVLERTRVYKVLAAWHLTMALGFQLTWACAQAHVGLQGPCGMAFNDGARVSADVGMCSIAPLGLKRKCTRLQYLCAQLHYQGTLTSFCLFFTL